MTTISAKVIAASKGHSAVLWTLQLQYPRFIHSEVMTHRAFSRNASSSRAIPVKKMLSQVWNDPAEPIHWGRNQKGMQAHSQLTGWRKWLGQKLWRAAGKVACCFVYALDKMGAHKQWANRLLEPWQYIHVIVTATEWANFFELRDHPDAQPEIRELAVQIRKAMQYAMYDEVVDRRHKLTEKDEWHLPYVTQEERELYEVPLLVAMSTARCARVSYLTHEGKTPTLQEDYNLYNRLVGSNPKHASPTEHQAKVFATVNGLRYNLNGFLSHRWLLDNGYMVAPQLPGTVK